MLGLLPAMLLLAAEAPSAEKARVAAEKFFASNERLGVFEYEWKQELRKLASDGSVKSRDTKHIRTVFIGGDRASIFLERNGKVATPAEIKQQEIEAQQKGLSPAERARKRAEVEKGKQERMGFLREFPAAFEFKVVGRELLDGRQTSVVEFNPRPGFKPQSIRSKVFLKSRGKLWLDETDLAVARIEAEAFDEMSIGGFLVHIGKGSRFRFTQARVDKDTWLPSMSFIKIEARVLFKALNTEQTETYWNYRKPAGQQASVR